MRHTNILPIAFSFLIPLSLPAFWVSPVLAQSQSSTAQPTNTLSDKSSKIRPTPAYPNDYWRSVGRDGKEFAPMLLDDTLATAKNPFSIVCLLTAGTAGIALHGGNADDPIADHYTKHGPQLNSFWDSVGDAGGNPGTHFALAGTLYFTSLLEDPNKPDCNFKNYRRAKTLLSALALNGILTSGLKIAARTESPNGNENVWPSGHTSSSFTVATVLYNEYGPWLGIPMFGFASYVGYERIDARNHNFSDVISGALIGVAVGHAVSQNHPIELAGLKLVPYVDPASGQLGLALAKRW